MFFHRLCPLSRSRRSTFHLHAVLMNTKVYERTSPVTGKEPSIIDFHFTFFSFFFIPNFIPNDYHLTNISWLAFSRKSEISRADYTEYSGVTSGARIMEHKT